jgi:hypothetical protein
MKAGGAASSIEKLPKRRLHLKPSSFTVHQARRKHKRDAVLLNKFSVFTTVTPGTIGRLDQQIG